MILSVGWRDGCMTFGIRYSVFEVPMIELGLKLGL